MNQKDLYQVNIVRIVQAAWVILAVLSLLRFTVSLAAYYALSDRICMQGLLVCHSDLRPTPQDLISLKADGVTLKQWAVYQIAYRILNAIFFCAISLLIFVRKRNDPPALLMALSLWLFGTLGLGGFLSVQYPQFAFLFNWITYLNWIAFPLFFMLFPNGRVVPRFMWVFVFVWSLYFLIGFVIPQIDKASPAFLLFSNIVWTCMFAGCIASQIYRYLRVSSTEERRQTKWVVTGLILWILIVLTVFLVPPFSRILDNAAPYSARTLPLSIGLNLSIVILPITIGIAILRYRLLDIDIIIRRTISYAILTALLGLVYYGGVTLLQGLFTQASGQVSPAALVISTLLIAAIFNPLRMRIQNFIDRRFYRRKYDAEKALAAFAAAARSETDIESLTGKLVSVAQETLQPATITLLLCPFTRPNSRIKP